MGDFKDVFIEDMGSVNKGQLRMADDNIKFLNDKTGKVISLNSEEISKVKWLRLANRPGIKLTLKDGMSYRIGGFRDSDYEKVNDYTKKNLNQDVEQLESALKGWNYGNCEVVGQTIEFTVDSKPAFEVPLSNVSNCIANKNEAVLEFHQNDDCPFSLMEMRFHIPGEEDATLDPVEEFRKAVLAYAGIESDQGQAIATLTQILCTTPRGRYDIKVYPNHLSFHGKTYDYKIPIKTIMRLFLVPHKDGRHVYFVISLNPPIRQGQTRYHYLVLEFLKDDEIDLELGLTDAQLTDQYGGKLEREMSGPVYEVVSKIFRVLIGMKITVPGNFVGHSGTPAVMCAHKQASGFLYPLEKGFLYIHKPPMYIRFEEVSSVHFARSDISTRSFDFEIELKVGQTLVFNSVEKEEYNKLYDYVQNKHLRIRNAKKMEKGYAEDRFAGSDDEFDPYKEHVKKEGKDRAAAAGSDDESDSDDDDYDLDEDLAKRRKDREERSDGTEGSESEPEEEWDSDAGSGTSEEEEATEKKKKKRDDDSEERKEKKKKKELAGDDAGDARKKKQKKDPNAPKRCQSAYFMWLNENRSKIKKDGDSVADTAKRAGEMWKSLSEEEKKPYEKKATDDKIRYESEMKEYKSSGAAASFKKEKMKNSPVKKMKSKSNATPLKSPLKTKSREFVTDSDDSDAPLEKVKKLEKVGEKKKVNEESASEASANSSDDSG